MTDSLFLDKNQYTPQGIASYELVWGKGFVSPGGAELAREFIGKLSLPPESLVLDVGSGLGGSAFLMAKEFGYRVEGIDLSRNMLGRADEHCRSLGLQDRVQFELADALELSADARYDAVYSRDAFLHIHRKPRLLRTLLQALKPGGKLLFTDYCCRDGPRSKAFADYVSQHHYCLHTVQEYTELLESSGFEHVVGEDLTSSFIETLKNDLAHLQQLPDTQDLIAAWNEKLKRALGGEQRWGLFTGRCAKLAELP